MTAHPIDTEALRELAERATPGPWEAQDYDDHPGDEGSCVLTREPERGTRAIAYAIAYPWTTPESCEADAEFIAAARTAVPALLDLLAAAEHRATRAEAMEKLAREQWRLYYRDLERAEARIKAVRDVHYPAHNDLDRTPFCETCKGAPGVHECGCWQDEQQDPVCAHCRGWKGIGPVDYPCPTIRALEG